MILKNKIIKVPFPGKVFVLNLKKVRFPLDENFIILMKRVRPYSVLYNRHTLVT